MNCRNCGGPMELVESRRYFQCRHCGTFHFPQTVEADGITIVGTAADALACPVCKAPMAHALLDGAQPVDFCATCRGVLLARPTFASVVNQRRAWATDPPAEPVPVDRRALRRELSCPKCRKRFETYPHYGPGNVVIDSCTSCDLVWLDFGEIRQIVDAPGRDRGSRHLPRIDDHYVRSGAAPEEEEHPHGSRDPLSGLLNLLLND